MPDDINLSLNDLRATAKQLQDAASQKVVEIVTSGFDQALHDQWKAIHDQVVQAEMDIRWLEKRLIDQVQSPIEEQQEVPARLLIPYLILERLGIYPPYSPPFNPRADQSRLAMAALYLFQATGQKIGYDFHLTSRDADRQRLTITSRNLPKTLQELDKITNPHFQLKHQEQLETCFLAPANLVASLLPVPEEVELTSHKWAELLAATHYANTDADEEAPESLLQHMLPAIDANARDFLQQAEQALLTVNLLPAGNKRRLHIDPNEVAWIEVRTPQGNETYDSTYPPNLMKNSMTCFLNAKGQHQINPEPSNMQELLDQCSNLAYEILENPRILTVAFMDEQGRELALINRCSTCHRVDCRQHALNRS